MSYQNQKCISGDGPDLRLASSGDAAASGTRAWRGARLPEGLAHDKNCVQRPRNSRGGQGTDADGAQRQQGPLAGRVRVLGQSQHALAGRQQIQTGAAQEAAATQSAAHHQSAAGHRLGHAEEAVQAAAQERRHREDCRAVGPVGQGLGAVHVCASDGGAVSQSAHDRV